MTTKERGVSCKHENADHLMPGECLVPWDDLGRIKTALAEQFRCLECGAWLSLGRARGIPRDEMSLAKLIAWRMGTYPDDPPQLLEREIDLFSEEMAHDSQHLAGVIARAE